ncbi:MAG: endonuclease domain-containing protein [Patescibacteria group bacterium]|nr:endonuclease domain-containing protein [Patescibacteria group bacterium]
MGRYRILLSSPSLRMGSSRYIKITRRKLRNNVTPFEQKLWNILRRKQFMGLKFRCQYSINNLIVDFFCPEKKIIIEVDGDTHAECETQIRDERLSELAKTYDLRIIRFANRDISQNIDGCLQILREFIENKTSTNIQPQEQK